ncbi:MAG: CoA transferase [Deltaproteobacteria bacterium]|nr:MAG: CoA transferase [Deltaproteobacteria bacterium]HEC32199.1 CoA transferase [Deltaproteobacteria bacterium]
MSAPLEGIKVLDLSRLLPGPFCSMLLADMGAEVIKIEAPGVGDYIRWWDPKLGNNSGMHVVLNRNKKSLTLNLKSETGKEIFRGLAKLSDVILEGFRPGVMDKLNLGYENLSELNPKIVYCAISGYGATGPISKKAGHDINFLALNGLLSYNGIDGKPTVPGVQIGDMGGGGLLAAFAILAAIIAREKTGKGQFIDISMTDGAMVWNCLRFGNWIADGTIPAPGDGMLNGGFACYNVYETKDGKFMALGALEPQFWSAFCQAVNRPDLDTPEYFKPGDHQKELIQELSRIFRTRTRAEWVEFLKDVDCCCEPVLNLEEASNSKMSRERGMIVEMEHHQWGKYLQLGIPCKFSETPGNILTHAPELGEHTDEILSDLGFSPEEIEQLRIKKVI